MPHDLVFLGAAGGASVWKGVTGVIWSPSRLPSGRSWAGPWPGALRPSSQALRSSPVQAPLVARDLTAWWLASKRGRSQRLRTEAVGPPSLVVTRLSLPGGRWEG